MYIRDYKIAFENAYSQNNKDFFKNIEMRVINFEVSKEVA
jgi:hypothetical protein